MVNRQTPGGPGRGHECTPASRRKSPFFVADFPPETDSPGWERWTLLTWLRGPAFSKPGLLTLLGPRRRPPPFVGGFFFFPGCPGFQGTGEKRPPVGSACHDSFASLARTWQMTQAAQVLELLLHPLRRPTG